MAIELQKYDRQQSVSTTVVQPQTHDRHSSVFDTEVQPETHERHQSAIDMVVQQKQTHDHHQSVLVFHVNQANWSQKAQVNDKRRFSVTQMNEGELFNVCSDSPFPEAAKSVKDFAKEHLKGCVGCYGDRILRSISEKNFIFRINDDQDEASVNEAESNEFTVTWDQRPFMEKKNGEKKLTVHINHPRLKVDPNSSRNCCVIL